MGTMNDAAGLFDSFYSKFILRDLFAKIVPGFLVLGAVAWTASGFDPAVLNAWNPSFATWVLLFGLAWLAGFVVQGVGEAVSFIQYDPDEERRLVLGYHPRKATVQANGRRVPLRLYDDKSPAQKWASMVEFDRKASPAQRNRAERYVVIKEATGNMLVSGILSVLLALAAWALGWAAANEWVGSWIPRVIPAGAFLLLAFLSLKYSHTRHVVRQYNYGAAIRALMPTRRPRGR